MGAPQRGRKIGQQTIPHLSWPIAFQPQRLTVGVPYVPTQSRVAITVIIDEHERIAEMCESNNHATREFQFDLAEIRAPRNRVGEIGGNVSAEIQRGIR